MLLISLSYNVMALKGPFVYRAAERRFASGG